MGAGKEDRNSHIFQHMQIRAEMMIEVQCRDVTIVTVTDLTGNKQPTLHPSSSCFLMYSQ
jgi:hypothetical protein